MDLRLIRSSYTLRVLLMTLDPGENIDWVSVDLAAQIIRELWLHREGKPGASRTRHDKKEKRSQEVFFHAVTPHYADWYQLTAIVKSHMPPRVRLVPFANWVDALLKSAEAAGGFQEVEQGLTPAANLIELLQNLLDKSIWFPHA